MSRTSIRTLSEPQPRSVVPRKEGLTGANRELELLSYRERVPYEILKGIRSQRPGWLKRKLQDILLRCQEWGQEPFCLVSVESCLGGYVFTFQNASSAAFERKQALPWAIVCAIEGAFRE